MRHTESNMSKFKGLKADILAQCPKIKLQQLMCITINTQHTDVFVCSFCT